MSLPRTDLPPALHLDTFRAALLVMADVADRAHPDTRVPTCPDWKVIDLVAHQSAVHRWAAGNLRGEDIDLDDTERQGRRAADRGEWLRDGAIEFATAWTQAPADVDAMVFLLDSPAPRDFWARRQCHETVIHAVDAVSADLGRHVQPGDVPWLTSEIAADGIDELLTGFLPRRKKPVVGAPAHVVIAPSDLDQHWVIDFTGESPVTTRGRGDAPPADAILTAPAVPAYLMLWNRSAEPTPPEWAFWAESVAIR